MWTELFTVGALAAALVLTPALAQEAPFEQQPPAAAEPQDRQPPAATKTYQPDAQTPQMADLTGWPIYSAEGEELGEVTGVKQGADGNVEAIHTNIGGFLGFGATTVAISADKFLKGDNRIDLTLSTEEVMELPAVAEE